MRTPVINIDGKVVGKGRPCFIVAEAGVNHNGNIHLAKKLIDAAKEAGADAVKFQLFIPNQLVTRGAKKAEYQIKTAGEQEDQYEMLKKLALSEEQYSDLQRYAQKKDIIFYATPHDLASVDIFARLDLPVIKIASGDLDNGLLFYKIANHPKLKSKPLFLSTGGGTIGDVEKSLQFLRGHGFSGPILVYHCTSSYPTPNAEQNLNVITIFLKKLAEKYRVLVGFSDNGDDVEIPVDAVILGAVSVEKHMTLNKNMEGPDHRASLDALGFAKMVKMIRQSETSRGIQIVHREALGDGIKRVQPSEINNIAVSKKAVRARVDMQKGDVITLGSLVPKRPKGTQSPMAFESLIGKSLKSKVKANTEITSEMVE